MVSTLSTSFREELYKFYSTTSSGWGLYLCPIFSSTVYGLSIFMILVYVFHWVLLLWQCELCVSFFSILLKTKWTSYFEVKVDSDIAERNNSDPMSVLPSFSRWYLLARQEGLSTWVWIVTTYKLLGTELCVVVISVIGRQTQEDSGSPQSLWFQVQWETLTKQGRQRSRETSGINLWLPEAHRHVHMHTPHPNV